MTTGSTDLRPPWMPQASRWLLALGIAGSALAVGTVHTITLCLVTVVLAAAAVLGWWGAEPMRARAPATLLLFTGIGLTLYTALQCVPMPIGWLAVIAPHNADVWSRALSPLREPGPSWAPITLDPIATRVEVLKGVAYLLAFVTALRVARRKEGVGFLSAVIVGTGVVLAVAALLHPAFGARRLFGLYEPGPAISDRHIAPLMNPNQLAAYINIAICIGVAHALGPELPVPRAIVVALVLVLLAVQIWVASRGGVVMMILGAFLAAGLTRRAGAKVATREKSLSLVLWLVAAAGAAMVALSSAQASGELFDTDTSKLSLFSQSIRMAASYPLLGAGRGSFASTFPQFRAPLTHTPTAIGYVTFEYPENVIAQWLTEWGIPLGVCGMVAILWALRPMAARVRAVSVWGAWAAIVVVAIHNLIDFSSEVPAVVITLTVAAAMVAGGTAGGRSTWALGRWSLATSRVTWVSALASVGALTLGWMQIGSSLRDDDRRMFEAVGPQNASMTEVQRLARGAMLRHPAEPYLPFTVARRAAIDRDPAAISWVGATLDRASVYGPAHLLLARLIGIRAASQARLEYRLAMEQAPELLTVALVEGAAYVGSYWDAMELAPDGPLAVPVLATLAAQLGKRLPATCTRLDGELEARAPGSIAPATRAAEAAVEDVQSTQGTPWCEGELRSACAADAMRKAARAEELSPTDCLPHELRARAGIAAGDVSGALDAMWRAMDNVQDRVPCLESFATLALIEHDDLRADSAIAQLLNATCVAPDECAKTLIWVASVEEARGRTAKAMTLYRRAFERAPEERAALASAALLASRAGLHLEAAQDYERLALGQGRDSEWLRAATAERAAAMSAVKQ